MHRSRLGALVIDCNTDDLQKAAEFWSAALGYRIAEDQPDPKYVALTGPTGEVTVLVQAVEHESRMHLDIETDDRAKEVARLERMGARKIADIKGWTVLEAPTGHRFCVVKPQRSDLAENGTVWNVGD